MFFVRCLLIALLLSVFGRAEAANPLDFEGLADGTVLSGQYSGLVFSNAIVLTSGISLNELEFPPHSGVNVASDNSGPMQIALASPVQSFAAYFTYATRLQVVAFGLNSSVVATVNSLFANNLALSGDSGSSPNERIQISFAGGISSLRITGMADGASFAIDDISISAVPEPGSLVMFALGALAIFRVSRRLPAPCCCACMPPPWRRRWVFPRCRRQRFASERPPRCSLQPGSNRPT